MMSNHIPYIDPSIERIGVSRLRQFNAKTLQEIDHLYVLTDNYKPLAVLLKYEQYLAIQNKLKTLQKQVELFQLANNHPVKDYQEDI